MRCWPIYSIASWDKTTVSDLLESHVAADDLVNLVLRMQRNELRHLAAPRVNREDGGTAPHHVDELDELQAHSHHHRVLEVSNWTNHLVVASEKGFDQMSFILRGPGATWDHTQNAIFIATLSIPSISTCIKITRIISLNLNSGCDYCYENRSDGFCDVLEKTIVFGLNSVLIYCSYLCSKYE